MARSLVVCLGVLLGCSSNDAGAPLPPAGASGSAGAGLAGASGAGGAAGIGGGGAGGLAGSSGVGGVVAGAGGSGATAGSGGSGGVAGTGGLAGSGGMAPGGCDYLICEDFEDTEPGGTPEGWEERGDASGVDDAEAKQGNRSLKIEPIASGQRRIARDASVLGSSHWGRIYYMVALPVPDAFVHSTIVALVGEGPNVGEAEFRVVDTVKSSNSENHQFLYNVQPDGAEFGEGTAYDWTFDGEWHCAEWYIDGPNQEFRFFYDGAELITIENGPANYDDTEIPDGFSEVRVGWNNYQSAPPGFTAWIDHVALDDERIGCD